MSQKPKFTEAEIKAVCAERNVSPTRAVEIIEAAAWHKQVEAGRQKSAEAPATAPAAS